MYSSSLSQAHEEGDEEDGDGNDDDDKPQYDDQRQRQGAQDANHTEINLDNIYGYAEERMQQPPPRPTSCQLRQQRQQRAAPDFLPPAVLWGPTQTQTQAQQAQTRAQAQAQQAHYRPLRLVSYSSEISEDFVPEPLGFDAAPRVPPVPAPPAHHDYPDPDPGPGPGPRNWKSEGRPDLEAQEDGDAPSSSRRAPAAAGALHVPEASIALLLLHPPHQA